MICYLLLRYANSYSLLSPAMITFLAKNGLIPLADLRPSFLSQLGGACRIVPLQLRTLKMM